MINLLLVLSLCLHTLTCTETTFRHPVSHHVVAQIKTKTQKWVPMDVDKNPFTMYSLTQLKSLSGAIHDPSIFDNMTVDEF